MNWQKLDENEKRTILSNVSRQKRIHENAVEKDWWVSVVLKAIFGLRCSEYLIFKGGTSLSKGWGLINRFSEDIDIAIDKSFWGIKGETKSQIGKLRRLSKRYVKDVLIEELRDNLNSMGVSDYIVHFQDTDSSDSDPSVIFVSYVSVLNGQVSYIAPRVKIEFSCRSLREPFEKLRYTSFISSFYSNEKFADKEFEVASVLPSRTFLEKIFLLHEEFQKDKIRSIRMTRHLYDLERLMDTEYARKALEDAPMYNRIVEHRRKYMPIRGIDYLRHNPSFISIVPCASVFKEYERDYILMQESFIYGKSLSFNQLIERIQILNDRIIRCGSIIKSV